MNRDALAFPRRGRDRVVAGVAGGFADTYRADPFVVRTALVVLCLAGGVGVLLYAAGLVISTRPEDGVDDELALARPGARRPLPPDARRTAAVGCFAGAVLFGARALGAWPGDTLMVPVVIIATGLGVLGAAGGGRSGRPLDVTRRTGVLPGVRWAMLVGDTHAWLRVVVGIGLLAWGLGALGFGSGALVGLRTALLGALLAFAGIGLAFGPQIARLAQQVGDERRERIRSEERAAMAAHLHDSVLQTLALIQRTAHDPRRTVTLARRQERELRAWLYATPDATVGVDGAVVTLAGAVAELAQEVEDLHDVQVEVVVVGDVAIDERVAALLAATREAAVNAAKHAGVADVAVFVEVDDDGLSAFVRDRGRGFDPATVPADRHGLARSVVARLRRVGGDAEIDTAPGAGTEVRLHLPMYPPAPPPPWLAPSPPVATAEDGRETRSL